MNNNPLTGSRAIGRWQWGLFAIGVLALAACIAGALANPRHFFAVYLASYLFWQGLGLGALAILLLYHMTGGAWGYLIRRILEAQMRTLPLLAVLYIPVAVGVGYLYDWARAGDVASSPLLQHQQFYLNKGFFWGRAAIYFALWLGMAWLLARWSRRSDLTGDPRYPWFAYYLAGPGAVILGLTYVFAGIDWLMSLQTIFPSTIFSALFAVGQILSANLLAVIVLARLAARPPLAEKFSLKAVNDLGNLAFAFLIIWAYLAFFQFMLVWIANLPADVVWYLPRSRGGWLVVAWILFVFHFAVPFLLLLLEAVKRRLAVLATVAGTVLVMHLLYLYWQVLPVFPAVPLQRHWIDILLPIGIGGLWTANFLHNLRAWPLLPLHDANRESALELRRTDEAEAGREEALAHG